MKTAGQFRSTGALVVESAALGHGVKRVPLHVVVPVGFRGVGAFLRGGGVGLDRFEKLRVLPDGHLVFVDPESGQRDVLILLINKLALGNGDHPVEILGGGHAEKFEVNDHGHQADQREHAQRGNDHRPLLAALGLVDRRQGGGVPGAEFEGVFGHHLRLQRLDGLQQRAPTQETRGAVEQHPAQQFPQPEGSGGPVGQAVGNHPRQRADVLLGGGRAAIRERGHVVEPHPAVAAQVHVLRRQERMRHLLLVEVAERLGRDLDGLERGRVVDRPALRPQVGQVRAVHVLAGVIVNCPRAGPPRTPPGSTDAARWPSRWPGPGTSARRPRPVGTRRPGP